MPTEDSLAAYNERLLEQACALIAASFNRPDPGQEMGPDWLQWARRWMSDYERRDEAVGGRSDGSGE